MNTDLEKIFENIRDKYGLKEPRLPPVNAWTPPFSGDIDIHIKCNGEWWYQGAPMQRQEIAKLFSTILKREGEEYFLVTPHEKWRIKVEMAPFMISSVEREGGGHSQVLLFTTTLGECFILDKEHSLQMETFRDQQVPTVMVRNNLKGALSRAVYYEVTNWVVSHIDEGTERLGVFSAGEFFPLD